jgi:hypothetical protein
LIEITPQIRQDLLIKLTKILTFFSLLLELEYKAIAFKDDEHSLHKNKKKTNIYEDKVKCCKNSSKGCNLIQDSLEILFC